MPPIPPKGLPAAPGAAPDPPLVEGMAKLGIIALKGFVPGVPLDVPAAGAAQGLGSADVLGAVSGGEAGVLGAELDALGVAASSIG